MFCLSVCFYNNPATLCTSNQGQRCSYHFLSEFIISYITLRKLKLVFVVPALPSCFPQPVNKTAQHQLQKYQNGEQSPQCHTLLSHFKTKYKKRNTCLSFLPSRFGKAMQVFTDCINPMFFKMNFEEAISEFSFVSLSKRV